MKQHSWGSMECYECREISHQPYSLETTVFEEWVASLTEFVPNQKGPQRKPFYNPSGLEVES